MARSQHGSGCASACNFQSFEGGTLSGSVSRMRRIAMICSSVNRDRFIVRSFPGPGL
jgi:hypothetical protein